MADEARRQDYLNKAITAADEKNYAEMSYYMNLVEFYTVELLNRTLNDEERQLYRVAHYNYLTILRANLRECQSASDVKTLNDDEKQLVRSYQRLTAKSLGLTCQAISWTARIRRDEIITQHVRSRKLAPVESQVIPLILRTGLHKLHVLKSCLDTGELRFEGRDLNELLPMACGELEDLLVHDVSTFCGYLKEVTIFREKLGETNEFLKRGLNFVRVQLTMKPLHLWLVLMSAMFNLILWTWHLTSHFLHKEKGVIRKTNAITVSTISDVDNVKDLRNAKLFDGVIVLDSRLNIGQRADLILLALEAFPEDKIVTS
ncbi:uncharacterized protein LOC141591963 [Silene latifolia]|uniref:uncharacterized protein LOC141591963 n=1 Tax=Silene latifolia TaxID=37657 RepID=UPI003D783978